MASNDHVFSLGSPKVSHRRTQVDLIERRNAKQTPMERKRPRNRSFHRFQRLRRPKDRYAFFQKPKLYSQASYIGPTNVEPFSSFKGSHVSESGQEEGFPNATCRMLGCWQREPHFHDLQKRLESGHGGNVPQAQRPHFTNVREIPDNERGNHSLVGKKPLRPPSPLVAGPACLLDRIVEPQSARSHHRLKEEPTKGSSHRSLESHRSLLGSSLLQPALGGTRDLRDALPLAPTSYETSHPRVLHPVTWQVNLPIHPKPSTKRGLESQGPRDRAICEASSSRRFRDPNEHNSKEEP